ncbi:MAG TPA: carbamoyltransferase C-terminal domain-containing protein [Streptosporangiaceae bacterium]|jgi:carbamoyltransferase
MSQPSIAGAKLTHDSAVALIRGNKLEYVAELEKTGNRARYATIERLEQVAELLAQSSVPPQDIDSWVLDGWLSQTERVSEPSDEVPLSPSLVVQAGSRPVELPVATYRELDGQPPLDGISVASPFPGISDSYRSHHHSTGHLAGGYCTSPFAAAERTAAVLVWDGGVGPRLYVVDPGRRAVRGLGAVLPLKGNVYAEVMSRFPPFRPPDDADDDFLARHELSVPGKAMAYAGLGTLSRELLAEMSGIYARLVQRELFVRLPFALADAVEEAAGRLGVSSADAINTWQTFLGNLLEDELGARVARHELTGMPLVLTGGCALNITWNSQLRDSGRFGDVWVPPFPNDSGSALGAACAEMMRTGDRWSLDWDVYRGPCLRDEPIPPGWAGRRAGLADVAGLLHSGTPVLVMHGQAELGPRALGHRSILAPATDLGMRDFLNEVKRREPYRPVAPICLEERASEVFDPGGRDPYMIFQHRIRPDWAGRIPAVSHVDGTARLQTVSEADEPTIHELLRCYQRLSGIPVLCNTSANHPGRGFFPSVAAALAWGGIEHVWSEGTLYTRTGPAAG